jgi:hypothetical protein
VKVLFAFLPFATFALLEHFGGVSAGLLGAAALSLAILLRDVLVRRRSPKLLATFAALGGAAAFTAKYPARVRARARGASMVSD